MTESIILRVRNFLGISEADVDLTGIALVSGINEAGKSSLLEAAASAAVGSPAARGVKTKKALTTLLHNDAAAGSVTLEIGARHRRVIYPTGEVEDRGAPLYFGSALGMNAKRFMGLTADERSGELQRRFAMAATIDDLRAWAKTAPEVGMLPTTDAHGKPYDPCEILWKRIDVSDWDAVHRSVAENATKLKGRWEGVTGQRWGTLKAAGWCRAPLLPGDTFNLELATAAKEDADDRLKQALVAHGVSDAERARLQSLADGLADAEGVLAEAKKATGVAQTAAEIKLREKNDLNTPVDTRSLPQCPHCKKPMRVISDEKGTTYHAVEHGPNKAEMDVTARKAMVLDKDFRDAQKISGDSARIEAQAAAFVATARDAFQRLAQLSDQPGLSDSALSMAKTAAADAETYLEAVKATATAQAITAEWNKMQPLIEALSPSGIRQEVMERRLGEVNKKLTDLCTRANIREMEITTEMNVIFHGHPYELLSESGRWRVDLMLALVMGQQEGAILVLIDRLDILHQKARPGVLLLLRDLKLNALIGMTAKDPEAAPSLEKAKIGRNYWIADGKITKAEAPNG